MNKRIKEKIKKRHGYKSWKRYNISTLIQPLYMPNRNNIVYYRKFKPRNSFENDQNILNNIEGEILHQYN